MAVNIITTGAELKAHYTERQTRTRVDFAMRRIFFTTVLLMDLAALGAIYWALVTYCPLPNEPLLASTFIAAILAGLGSMKIPTAGVNPDNYKNWLTPVYMLGRVVCYTLFGPALLIHRNTDWTDYRKGVEVNRIFGELKSQKFEDLSDTYGPRIKNLQRYGLMPEAEAKKMGEFYVEMVPLKLRQAYLLKYADKFKDAEIENPNKKQLQEVRDKIAKIENQWRELQSTLLTFEAEVNTPRFEWRVVRWYREYRFATPSETPA